MSDPQYYGRRDRDRFLRDWRWIIREQFSLHAGIAFERMIEDLYADLAQPNCSAWQQDQDSE